MTVSRALIARPRLWALACASALTAVLWIATLAHLQLAHEIYAQSTQRNLLTIARSLHAHALKTLQLADQAATFIQLDYDVNGKDMDLQQLVQHRALSEDMFTLFAVVDKDGNIVLSSVPLDNPVNIADREHFKVHIDHDSHQLYVGEPTTGRASGRESIHLSRRLNGPAGSFDGVIVVALNPYYFTDVYRSLGLGEQSVISLWRDDGLGLVRRSDSGQAIGVHLPDTGFLKSIKEGGIHTLSSWSPVDNVQRLWAFQRLEDLPLLVSVGLGVEQENKPYQEMRNHIYLLAALLTTIIFAFAVMVGRFLQKLHESRRAAVDANKAKSDFLSNVSHELRTPLNGILGYAELLELQEKEPEKRDFIRYIHQSGTHLLALVNSLLTLNRIEKGQLQMTWSTIPIQSMVQEIINTHKPQADKKGLDLNIRLAPSTPQDMISDRVKLMQILHNLIQNSIKFTTQGSVNLSVDANQHNVIFTVSDTGCGISPENLQSIFDRFFQATNNIAASEGLGLGLAIAKQLTQLLGGTISAQSRLGQGTTFTIMIPRVPPEAGNGKLHGTQP